LITHLLSGGGLTSLGGILLGVGIIFIGGMGIIGGGIII